MLPSQQIYRTGVFFFIFGLIGLLTFLVFRPVLGLISASLVSSIVLWPIYKFLHQHLGGHRYLATLVTIFLAFIGLFLPAFFFIRALILQIVSMANLVKVAQVKSILFELVREANFWLAKLPPELDFQLAIEDIDTGFVQGLKLIGDWLAGSFWSVGNTSVALVINLTLLVMLVFFLLPKLPDLKNFLMTISPLSPQATNQYFARSFAMLKDVLRGILLVAVVQGALAGLMLAIMGVPAWAFLTVAMMFLAILPIGSVNFIMIPIGVGMLFSGHAGMGVFTIAWSLTVVSTIDNYLRSILVSKTANVHPAVMMIAVLGGLKAFGFMGILYGPLIVVLFLTTLAVYQQEYSNQFLSSTPPSTSSLASDEVTS